MSFCKKTKTFKERFNIGFKHNNETLKTKLVRDNIKLVLANAVFPEDVEANVLATMLDPESGFKWKHPVTAKYQARNVSKCILRYTNGEKRVPEYLDSKELYINGIPVWYKPDEVFRYEETIDDIDEGSNVVATKIPVIEIVKFKASKPNQDHTQSGAEKGNTDSHYFELYKGLLYGRTLINSKDVKIKSSIYYLRKNSDKNEKEGEVLDEHFDEDFFSTDPKRGMYAPAAYSGNIIRLSEKYKNGLLVTSEVKKVVTVKTTPKTKKTTEKTTYKTLKYPIYDKVYKECIKANLYGKNPSDCSDKECEKCEFLNSCKPTLPPMRKSEEELEEEKSKIKRKRLSLNPEQLKAANFDLGFCRINAGAGTGKTETVKAHYTSLISKGVDPSKILCITFTDNGANEMKVRIRLSRNMKGVNPNSMHITTFNAFGDEYIKKNYKLLDYTQEPKIIDSVERKRIIADILRDEPEIEGLDYANFTMDEGRGCKGALAVVSTIFELAKERGYSVTDAVECVEELKRSIGKVIRIPTCQQVLELYDKYDNYLRAENLIEFNDQITLLFELAYNDMSFFEDMEFEHIIVDEFQDTNEIQIEVLKRLIDTPSFKSLMVVGDDSQAIYAFRGSSPEFLINFEKVIGHPIEDIYLLENYRCTPEIIDFANKINEMNVNRVAKNLIAHNESGDPVTVAAFLDEKEEYKYIVEQVSNNIKDGVAPEDICIITRDNNELKRIGDLLTKVKIPSVIQAPEPLLNNTRVLAAIGMIHALEAMMKGEKEDTTGLIAYASAMSGYTFDSKPVLEQKHFLDAMSDRLHAIARIPDRTNTDIAKKHLMVELLKEIDDENLPDELYENFVQTIEFKANCQEIFDYVHDFEVYGQNVKAKRTQKYPGVVLSTAHSSKGLEWDYIYVTLSNFDKSEDEDNLDRIEETRRLLFVSGTRARKRLVITGQWVAYKKGEDSKHKEIVYNRYLIDSFNAIGEDITVLDAAKIEKVLTDAKKIEADKKRALSKILDEKNQKMKDLKDRFYPRKSRKVRGHYSHTHNYDVLRKRHSYS